MFLIYKVYRGGLRRIRNFVSTLFYRSVLRKVGSNPRIFYNFYCSNPKGILLGDDCLIDVNVCLTTEFKDSILEIGNNVNINEGVHIDYSGGVIIEDDVLISKDAYILSHSHGYDPRSTPVKKPLRISKGVWIGAKVIICENVSVIEEGAIIASGAIVTKNVERNTIVGGNPAKFIKKI
ncbi:acyltransferase [Tenacibaculum sp. 190524A05c]|uniref:Lipopolysaccharide biosynthesis O-acetyl transferase WbbJ n=1 Tax=Tenacibaculum platacis TaxID=3137852 RepID=A0ABM9P3W3_9FLAO